MFSVVRLDSMFLVVRVSLRRLHEIITNRGKNFGNPSKPRLLYIDCGVHKRGEQIRWMYRWFADRYDLHVLGFEASAEHFCDATAALADMDQVRLHHVALVGPDHEGDEVRLYKSGGNGEGDSLFGVRGEQYELVPARRLSQVLADEGYVLSESPVILRMNIEGAEHFVIDDLLDARLHTSIDGYYGMWDDLSKIDPNDDSRFRQLLRDYRISKLTFNDRDLPFWLRRYAIRTDIETSIRAGLGRVKNAAARSHHA